MKLKLNQYHRVLRFVALVFGMVALGVLLFWLLPVAIQSRLSADHVRRAFGSVDISPVASESLSSVWTLLLKTLRTFGLGVGSETLATSAALSGWIFLSTVILMTCFAPWPAVLLAGLAPAVLWSAVIPNGISLSFLLLVLIGVLANPSVNLSNQRVRWTFGAVFEGLGCSMTPLAWIQAILRSWQTRKSETSVRQRTLRAVLFLIGFSVPIALGILIDANDDVLFPSFSRLPVLHFLKALQSEDTLGAGRVILGGGGEIAIGLLASMSILAVTLLMSGWRVPRFIPWFILVVPFLLLAAFGSLRSWHLLHPGWNTVIEDFAQNIEKNVSRTTIAIVPTSTEEAAIRFVDELLVPEKRVVAIRSVNLLEPTTIKRLRLREPRFSVEEMQTVSPVENVVQQFVDRLVVPNVNRGVQFWLEFPPDRNQGLEIQFLSTGLRVASSSGVTRFITDREILRAAFIRARPTAREYLAGPAIETQIFARYAMYHLAVAHVIEKEKKTSDWVNRARGEYYAALKKVEWLAEAYTKVCIDPKIAEAQRAADEKSAGRTIEKTEPLDICIETEWYYSR